MNTQQEPERVQAAISVIEVKLHQIKRTIEDLLRSLDLQDKVTWGDILDKYASLAHEFSQVELLMKKSAIPAGEDNNGLLFKTHLVVPQEVTLDINPALQAGTDGRIGIWNHEIVPESLRTKLTPEVETEDGQMEADKHVKNADHVQRQIQAMNKHVETLMNHLNDAQKSSEMKQSDAERDAEADAETMKLVRAIMRGEGLRPDRPSTVTTSGSSQGTKR